MYFVLPPTLAFALIHVLKTVKIYKYNIFLRRGLRKDDNF